MTWRQFIEDTRAESCLYAKECKNCNCFDNNICEITGINTNEHNIFPSIKEIKGYEKQKAKMLKQILS